MQQQITFRDHVIRNIVSLIKVWGLDSRRIRDEKVERHIIKAVMIEDKMSCG